MLASDANIYREADLPNGWSVGRFPALEALGVPHLVTTKAAPDPQMIRHDPAAAADALAEAMGLAGVAWLEQMHGEAVVAVEGPGYGGPADALVTATRGLGLMVVSADCPLILLADDAGRAVAAVHASWRSTVRQIALKVAEQLVGVFRVPANSLTACICPSAGPERYEVGPEVRGEAIRRIGPDAGRFFRPGPGDRWMMDLWAMNVDQLVRAGLRPDRVHVAGVCTIASTDRYPSHRAEGDAAGRFAAVIARPG